MDRDVVDNLYFVNSLKLLVKKLRIKASLGSQMDVSFL